MGKASFDDVLGGNHIVGVEKSPRAGHARHAADMEHDVPVATGVENGLAIAKIAANNFGAEGFEMWSRVSAKSANTIAACEQLLDDVLTKESACAGNQCVHGFF
jgi:hypothetical protein